MSFELQTLYQEIILDHNKAPRNFRIIDSPSSIGKGFNPLCGDQVEVYIQIESDKIIDISFQGQGCAISTASASLMTESIKGKTLEEAQKLFENFHSAIMEDGYLENNSLPDRLNVLTGVKKYPSRVKCATLAWHALNAAIHKQSNEINTK